MSRGRSTWWRVRVLVVGTAGVGLAALAFACGSDDPVGPLPCEGAGCVEGGAEASVTDGPSTADTGVDDSASDSHIDGSSETGTDGAACVLRAPAGDAGVSGTVRWAMNFGSTGYATASAVSVDPASGDIVVVGEVNGSIDFGGGLSTNGGPVPEAHTAFLVRFDTNGVHRWSKTFSSGTGFSVAGPVAIDSTGNVIVAGGFQGTVDFGGGALSAVSETDIFIASFDSAGAHRWSKRLGVAGESNAVTSLAVDKASNVIVGGLAYGALDFGGGPLGGFYLAKLSPQGTHVWSKGFRASSPSGAPRLAVDPDGNVVIAGSFSGTADFGGGGLTSAGGVNAFVAKYGATGDYRWSRRYGTSGGAVSATSVATDPCGALFVTGSFFGTVDFAPGLLSAADSSRSYGFLAKLDPTGSGVWAKKFEAASTTNSSLLYLSLIHISEPTRPY